MANSKQNKSGLVRTMWSEITKVSPKIKAADKRRQSELLSVLLIALAPVTLFFGTLPSTLEISPQLILHPVAITTFVSEFFFLIAYLMNRRGHYRVASSMLIGIMTVLSFTTAIAVDLNMLPFMVIPLLFSSVLSPFSELHKWTLLHLFLILSTPIYITTITFAGIVSGVFGFFALFSIVIVVARKQRDNLEKDRLQEITEAKDWLATTLRSIGDAVIATNEQGKVEFMNPVAEELTGWKQSSAKGKDVEKVFNIVNEETKKPVDNPVTKVLETGTIVGLANHTLLISKDGKEIAIKDSGAPIKDLSGEITGAVLVFRDVTEDRKQERIVEEKLKEADIFMSAAIDREERIQELKKKLKELKEKP